jgi:membrane protease YdiL (CAAX protease family)
MKHVWWWVAAMGFAAAWFILDDQRAPARAWGALMLVPIPVLVARQTAMMPDAAALPRRQLYTSTIVGLWILAAITTIASRWSALDSPRLGLVLPPALPLIIWSAGLTLAGIAIIYAARALGVRESDMTRRMLPTTRAERTAFTALSLTAGFCEELIFRGFLLHLMHVATDSMIVAVAVTAAIFGWMHAYQQPGGAVRAAVLGALLSLAPALTASIAASIIAHAALDIIAGIFLRDRLDPDVA